MAGLARAAGMVPGAGAAIVAVARTAGWLAHGMEEYARGRMLRPRAVYTGPRPGAEAPERTHVTWPPSLVADYEYGVPLIFVRSLR